MPKDPFIYLRGREWGEGQREKLKQIPCEHTVWSLHVSMEPGVGLDPTTRRSHPSHPSLKPTVTHQLSHPGSPSCGCYYWSLWSGLALSKGGLSVRTLLGTVTAPQNVWIEQ